mgnify:CR=1 FL=1
MEIKKPAVAGTMESSDCMVTIRPGEGKNQIDLQSDVKLMFGDSILKTVESVLEEMESVSSDPDSGITAVFSINRQAMDYSESKKFSRQNYPYTLENILRLLQCPERKNAAACPDRGRAV